VGKKIPVEIKGDRLIINADEMEINKRYPLGEYVVVKGKSGKIYIYEIVEKDIIERINQMHEKYNKKMKELGYDECSLEEFLDWLEDQIRNA